MADSGTLKVTRARKPKVRTGCRTCKARRVKCDERHPCCMRCESYGTKCEGYDVSRPFPCGAAAGCRLIVPRHSRTTDPQIWRGPSSVLFNDDTQGRYFSFFYSDVVPRVAISGPFHDCDFWRGIVLRECWREPALTAAIAAVGALSKALLSSSSHWVSDANIKGVEEPNADYVYALQHYHQALRQMREIKDLRHILLACMLVFCFENYNERPDLGVGHVQVGFQLIKGWLRNYKPVPAPMTAPSPAPHIIEHDLLRCFAMFDIHLITFSDVMPSILQKSLHRPVASRQDPKSSVPALLNDMPDTFSSLREARMYLYRLLAETFEYSYSFKSIEKCGGLATVEYESRAKDLQSWFEAFSPFWRKAQQIPVSHPESFPTMVLRLMAKHCELTLAGQKSSSECIYDEYLSSFQEILIIARKMNLDLQTTKQIFVGNGVVSPLFAVATKCRDRKIRAEAIELLKAVKKREGVWDSRLAALAAEWIKGLEEDATKTEWIPENKRVRLSSVILDAQSCLMHLECTSRGDAKDQYMLYKTHVIKWG